MKHKIQGCGEARSGKYVGSFKGSGNYEIRLNQVKLQ